MEKQKRWHLYLILAVVILTVYNILPTIFFYTKPLHRPIDETSAEKIAEQIATRVNSLESDSIEWVSSFSKSLGLTTQSITLLEEDPGFIKVTFINDKDAEKFRRFLPRAGALIPFAGSQLELYPHLPTLDQNTVIVERNIHTLVKPNQLSEWFSFVPKSNDKNVISNAYRTLLEDRVAEIALAFGGTSENAQIIAALGQETDPAYDGKVIAIASEIVDASSIFDDSSPLLKRYYSSYTRINRSDKSKLITDFKNRIDRVNERLDLLLKPLLSKNENLQIDANTSEQDINDQIKIYESQQKILNDAKFILVEKSSDFIFKGTPLSRDEIMHQLREINDVTEISLKNNNPFVEGLLIDWEGNTLSLKVYDDVQNIRFDNSKSEFETVKRDKLNQWLLHSIATVSKNTEENFKLDDETFSLSLTLLPNPSSFLTLHLGKLAEERIGSLNNFISNYWSTTHPDLARDSFPIITANSLSDVSNEKLGIILYAPVNDSSKNEQTLRSDSLYVLVRGINPIFQKYQDPSKSPEAQTLSLELKQLHRLLEAQGFISYPGNRFNNKSLLAGDLIFELNDFYAPIIHATRENFYVKGSKKEAVLEFTNLEQRILTLNRIQDRIQEDLLKWKEGYEKAIIQLDPAKKLEVPPPTKNVYIENFKLGWKKYFRGDDQKILRWGLDLSGGKTVRIALRDEHHRRVTNPEDLNQAVNELYTRLNNLGVAERTIRIEGNSIVLDFPGAQELSASELIQGSAMYFHIVNEKFSSDNPLLKDAIHHFLQEVWNEAIVTDRKDIQSINEISWERLGGSQEDGKFYPRSESAKLLYENGLRLANPKTALTSSSFDDTLSKVATMRGDDYADWGGQTHPLLIVFNNYALEGANLTNVQVGFDPKEGNVLTFSVKSFQEKTGKDPRDDFNSWTTQFSQDQIIGTPKEKFTQGLGWRMAILLNDQVISQPSLKAALRDGGSITGRFSQREINQLAADLKAGSLSFTPVILSEENVSPELGLEERSKGIMAAVLGLTLVIVAMVAYYHFAGLVASIAVLFNLLIMWGVLQNLGAAITLPGIAGIVLTIGMAVDANVLVFERVREEFSISGRIATALHTGYRKAFSAIIDSNVTTIIAALILIQFDSGPIKGFALTLIIGIASSMFTALFLTRYFFAGWVKNPKNKALTISNFIGNTKFDFLKHTKKAITISAILILVGAFFFAKERKTLFGMDFTGGYSLTVNFEESSNIDSYRITAENALIENGASPIDVNVRELSKPNALKIFLGMGMEESGRPFYHMPDTITGESTLYSFQENPRITWVIQALKSSGLQLSDTELENLDKNWTVMSGQFSETMRRNAIWGLSLALLAILIYITIRFEFKYAIGAVIALAHDVLITLGLVAIFHNFNMPIQIDLEVIGAIMTIIGYSLNDTIIIFDRIREDLRVMRKNSFKEIINHALNVTLSRTMMTSGTTLLVLLALDIFGGTSIFGFSLVMTIGVVVGTLSSLFVAGPVLLFFHNREIQLFETSAKKT